MRILNAALALVMVVLIALLIALVLFNTFFPRRLNIDEGARVTYTFEYLANNGTEKTVHVVMTKKDAKDLSSLVSGTKLKGGVPDTDFNGHLLQFEFGEQHIWLYFIPEHNEIQFADGTYVGKLETESSTEMLEILRNYNPDAY